MNRSAPEPQSRSVPGGQRGVALAVALIILIVTTIIALSASRFTMLEVKQSSNFELVRDAQQSAQSIVEGVVSLPQTILVTGAVGDVNCTNTPALTGCTTKTIVLPGNMFAAEIAADQVWAKAERLAPLFRGLPRIRGTGSSTIEFKGATFSVQGSYDRTADRLSRARVDQGYIVPVQVGGAQ